MTIDLLSAFFIGLLGAGHCIGMCGGISSMLTSALDKNSAQRPWYVLSYNAGRILSYALIGAIAGFTGSLTAKSLGLPIVALKFVAGIFIIFLGLYIGRWLMWLSHIEKIGQYVWRFLSPYSKKLIPVKSLKQSFLLGSLWGWLPCGLVYSTLTWALASQSTINGALIMASFGLGTLPALLTVSFGIINLKHFLQRALARQLIAITLIIYGIFTLKFAYQSLI